MRGVQFEWDWIIGLISELCSSSPLEIEECSILGGVAPGPFGCRT